LYWNNYSLTRKIFVVAYVLSFVAQSTRSFCYNTHIDENIECAYYLAGVDNWYDARNSTGALANNIGGVAIPAALM
jgi:hypothetical protein